jgi:hypothetical protein
LSNSCSQLLVAIIKTSQPKIDHAAVAAYMGDSKWPRISGHLLGVNRNLHSARTIYAVQHQIRKLQKLAANANPCNDKEIIITTKKPAPIKHAKAIAKRDERDTGDENNEQPPMKKQKLRAEREDEGDGDIENA